MGWGTHGDDTFVAFAESLESVGVVQVHSLGPLLITHAYAHGGWHKGRKEEEEGCLHALVFVPLHALLWWLLW